MQVILVLAVPELLLAVQSEVLRCGRPKTLLEESPRILETHTCIMIHEHSSTQAVSTHRPHFFAANAPPVIDGLTQIMACRQR